MNTVVHVIDDDLAVRTAIGRMLKANGYDVALYGSAGEFLLQGPAGRPGCILADIQMPGPSGLDLQYALKQQGATNPVIFMTGHAEVKSCISALRAGAVDYLEKPIDPELLVAAVARATDLDQRSRHAQQQKDALLSAFNSLSRRERQVFDMVVEGKLNKQIADALHIAERTVKAQRATLMDKLGADSAAGLGQLAERLRAFDR